MRIMEMLETVRTPAELNRVRKAAMARTGWNPALFDAKAAPVLKRLAAITKPSPAAVAKAKGPQLVQDYGPVELVLTPHDGTEERKPLPELATIREVRARRCKFARKERVAVGPVVISVRAWETMQDGGTIRVWLGKDANAHMHYASLAQ